MTTIPIYYNIKDLFKEDEINSIEKEYSCGICCELVYKLEFYQCSKGHFSCKNCWLTIIEKSNKKCMICRNPIKSFDCLSRSLFIENSFQNKKVSCPYSFKENIKSNKLNNKLVKDEEHGCKEFITVELLDSHSKNCNHRYVRCDNKGCSIVLRNKDYIEKHDGECKHKIIECELCSSKIKRLSMINHKKKCPSRLVQCNQCTEQVKYSDLDRHIEANCVNSIISCKFEKHGCAGIFKRKELPEHLENIDHTIHMCKVFEHQSKKLKKYKIEIVNQKNEIENQKQQIEYQNLQIESQKNNFEYQKQQIEYQNLQIENQKNEIKNQQNKINFLNTHIGKIEEFQNTLYALKKYTEVLDNLNSYQLIIKNFIERVGHNGEQIKKIIKIGGYEFYIKVFYEDYNYKFGLYSNNSEAIEVDCTFEILNCIENCDNLVLRNNTILNREYGFNFRSIYLSKDSYFIEEDDSLTITVNIKIIKTIVVE